MTNTSSTAPRRCVVVAGGRRVTLAGYVRAVKKAKANPTMTFTTGLTCWWPCTGAEIMSQFRLGLHDRINQAIPATRRGLPTSRCR